MGFVMAETEKCPGQCSICGEEAEDRCEQLTGPCCHISLTFEDCTSGAYTRRVRQRNGIPTEAERANLNG